MDVKKARFIYNGAELGFYEYVRVAVSGGKMRLQSGLRTEGDDADAVQRSQRPRAICRSGDIKDGISDKAHPARLPDNIYGSDDMDWETYSTPSRDARIKAAFVQFYKDLAEMIGMWVNRDPRIVYDGQFLQAGSAARPTTAQSEPCTITYLSSDKRPVPLTFDDMMHRLFAMSFDPYHCIELRWGAEGDERSSLPRRQGKAALVRGRAAPAQPARPHL